MFESCTADGLFVAKEEEGFAWKECGCEFFCGESVNHFGSEWKGCELIGFERL